MKVDGFCMYCGEERLETCYWRKMNTYFVRCRKCGATGPSYASTEREAVELFNRRVGSPNQGSLLI